MLRIRTSFFKRSQDLRYCLRVFAAFPVLLALNGCIKSELVTHGISYNQALADTHNKLILLNTVRAAYRYPMYFSDTGPLTTRATDEISLGLDYKFGPDAAQSHTLKPSFKYSGGATTMNFANLNRMEFTQKAIFEEVALNTLDFYVENGWNRDLLFTLMISGFEADLKNLIFVERIAYAYCRQGNISEYKKARCADFVDDRRIDYRGRFETRGDTITIGNGGNNFEIFQHLINMFFILDGDINEISEKPKRTNQRVERGKISYEYKRKTNREIVFRNAFAKEKIGRRNIGKNLKIALRSPQAIIFYIGELARRQLNGKNPAEIPVGGPKMDTRGEYYLEKAPLVLVKSGSGQNPAVRVQHAGQSFHVPEPDISSSKDHRTLQVFALINQLLTLATSESSVPKPSTVLVAN